MSRLVQVVKMELSTGKVVRYLGEVQVTKDDLEGDGALTIRSVSFGDPQPLPEGLMIPTLVEGESSE